MVKKYEYRMKERKERGKKVTNRIKGKKKENMKEIKKGSRGFTY